MRFQPKTEDELNPLFEKGNYEFLIKAAEEKFSKSNGDPMIKLVIQVWRPSDGRSKLVNDYLMANNEFGERKLWNFCAATGLLSLYQSGELQPEDCIGKSGVLKLRIQEDKTGQYPDQNSVSDYVIEKTAAKTAADSVADANRSLMEDARNIEPEGDKDNIPF